MAGPIDPGQLSARLRLERPLRASDGQGGHEVSFETVAMLFGRIDPVSVMREEDGARTRSLATHRVLIRARNDIKAGMRFRIGARVLSISGVIDADGSGRYLTCHVEEAVA